MLLSGGISNVLIYKYAKVQWKHFIHVTLNLTCGVTWQPGRYGQKRRWTVLLAISENNIGNIQYCQGNRCWCNNSRTNTFTNEFWTAIFAQNTPPWKQVHCIEISETLCAKSVMETQLMITFKNDKTATKSIFASDAHRRKKSKPNFIIPPW